MPEKGIAAISPGAGFGSTADLTLGYLQCMSFSEPLVCSGTSGRSSTIGNSALSALILAKCEYYGWMRRIGSGKELLLAGAIYGQLQSWIAHELAWITEVIAL